MTKQSVKALCLLLLTWDNIGDKISIDILYKNTQQMCFQKFMHTPRKGVYQSCIKNCEISNFGFLAFFMFNMVVNGESKMCNILETVGCRAKQTKFGPLG